MPRFHIRHSVVRISLVYCGIIFISSVVAGEPKAPTPVEHESQWWPAGQGGGLGTIQYAPSERETLFFNRLSEDEMVTGSMARDYHISTRDQKYVGWFGIVRGIGEDATNNRTVLTIEHKYFDGLTDAHLQTVSFNGSGDFEANLAGTDHRIPPLSLVKVYGIVTTGRPPRIGAEFVRCWHWGTFSFLAAYGAQRGNEEWRKANQIPLDDIYEAWPHPSHHYYEERLGKRPDGPAIRQRLLEAAGPVSPAALVAMERLADLLLVGHSWSQGETLRQMQEGEEIRKLVAQTASAPAAINLLRQALQENDERVSWTASEKFRWFDRGGEAIERLTTLLAHPDSRVRAGAARALALGYGPRAEPAVDVLSRCLSDSNSEVRHHAIIALASIGPSAEAALPTLRSALVEQDLSERVDLIKAVWRIGGQPADVVPVLIAALQQGDEGDQYEAIAQLKEMGHWAAPAVPALIAALKDEECPDRSGVVEALGDIGPAAAEALPAVAEALKNDEDTYVQANAAEALGKLRDPAAIPYLIAALKADDEYVRMNATDALTEFKHQASAAIPALIHAVQKDDWNAATALAVIDSEGISTPILIETLGSPKPGMRRFAAIALGRIGSKAIAAESALRNALSDADRGTRIDAAEAYWAVTGKADEPVAVLRSILQSPQSYIDELSAARALAGIGPASKPAVPELIACLESEIHNVSAAATDALGRIGPSAAAAVPVLVAKLEACDNDESCACLARALWRISRSEKSLPVLREVLTTSQDFIALTEALEAIGEMGEYAVGVEPLLRPLLKDSNSFVREAAAAALQRLEAQ